MLRGDGGLLLALLAAESAAASGVAFSPRWLGLIVPVTAALVGALWRSLTAKERVRKKYSDDVQRVTDSARASIVATVANIVTRVHGLGVWPSGGLAGRLWGQPGDPETELARRLEGQAQFSAGLTSLEVHGATARDAASAKERIVRFEHACAWLFGALLVPWVYFAFWASTTGVALPRGLTIGALAISTSLLGAVLTLKVLEQREASRLSDVVDSLGKSSGQGGAT